MSTIVPNTHTTGRLPVSTAGDHPNVEEWLAYHGGDLATDEEERLRDHLVSCPDCVSLLLDIEAFHRPETTDDVPSDFEVASAWRALREEVDRLSPDLSSRRNDEGETPPVRSKAAGDPARFLAGRLSRQTLPLAAAILAGVVGLTGWTVEHRRAGRLAELVAESRAPQPNAPIHDLRRDTRTRSGAAADTVTVERSAPATLVLHLGRLPSADALEVELVDAEGGVAWAGGGFEAHPDFLTVRLGLPREALPAGEYVVRLYGVEGGGRSLLEEYPPIRLVD